MIPANLLTLWVAVPLMTAGLLVAVRVRALHRVMLILVPLASIVGSLLLLAGTRTTPVIAHVVGGYEGAVGIPFAADALSAVMLLVTALATLGSSLYLIVTGEDQRKLLAPLILMLTTGVNGALLTADLFNLFVWVEVMLMPSYALLALTGTWKRLGMGRLFVLVNLLTSSILVFGVGMVYATAGTVSLAVLAGKGDDPRTAAAMCLVLLALLVKGSLFPVHSWLPRAYPATSGGIMGLFSALHTKVALYAVYRITSIVFDGTDLPLAQILAALVVITMLVGAFATAAARDLRTVMAHQMVAGVGHILLGVLLATEVAAAAGILYMVHHIITMGSLILTAGAVEETYGTGRLNRLRGLASREPVATAVIALGLFSLVGLPPTSGLWGKVGLMQAAGDSAVGGNGLGALVVAAIILASIVSLIALQRIWMLTAWGDGTPGPALVAGDDADAGAGEQSVRTGGRRIPAAHLLPGIGFIVISVLMFLGIGQILPAIDGAAAALTDVRSYAEAVLGQ